MTALPTTSPSDVANDIISTQPMSLTVTPPPTSRSTTDFEYVDYDDYGEYSAYDGASGDTPDMMPTTAVTATPGTTVATTTATRPERKTAPPLFLERNYTTPTVLPAAAPGATDEGPSVTVEPVRTSAVPEFPTTTMSADPDDIITATSPPNRTSGGRSLQTRINLTKTEATPTSSSSSSFFPLSKKENNSVDEVPYRIVGLDGDVTRGQANYFVPRMPPFRERTQNKRIQQLLNEKRRQDLLRRSNRSREGRTDRKHVSL